MDDAIVINISHLNNALSDIIVSTLKEPRKLILSHLFNCRSIFIHLIQQPLVPDSTYSLKITITHVDNVRVFNITKIIR